MNEWFPDISKIKYEGPDSTNPLSFHHYDPDETVESESMREHLRFSVAYWHSFRYAGVDQFGAPTRHLPWDDGSDTIANATTRVRVAFEFFEKLGVDYYCFHDRDIAPEGNTLMETNKNLDAIVEVVKQEQERTGLRPLWGTANLFSHPRYMHGAATSPNADVFAFAAAQVKKAIEITHHLGGVGFTFWGGREGYKTLLNTDMGRELDHLGAFLHMAVDFKKKIGFEGQLYIEPKPKEPTKHQYDHDAAACYSFLQKYDLDRDLKLNLEANHATLAGHAFAHEIEYASANGVLGSIDANRGDLLLGWDTDQFPTDVYSTTYTMLSVLKMGGFLTGGLNFDARVARESFEPVDLFHAHIGGMDAFARGLRIAARIRKEGLFEEFMRSRYQSWSSKIGAQIESGETGLEELERYMLEKGGEPAPNQSGRVEMLENYINQYLR